MRTILNAILAFIGAESLTDDEFEVAEGAIDDVSDNSEVYNGLLLVLDERESVSNMQERLRYYYLAKGVVFGAADQAKSNIFIGGVL